MNKISGAAFDTLHACYEKGPLLDGDLPSKRGRDEMLECGAIVKTFVNGKGGFNACTHLGREILNRNSEENNQ